MLFLDFKKKISKKKIYFFTLFFHIHSLVFFQLKKKVENIMICKGKVIEIESGEFSAKYNLISRCLFLSKLLEQANLNDSKLETDPLFYTNESKCIIKFQNTQDAEEFINCHNSKYRIILKNVINNDTNEEENLLSNFDLI